MQLLNNLEWRYATKQFNPHKIVDEDQIDLLKKAIQLSPSSYGLQLYKVFVIKNPELRETLKSHSWNQNQITEASHLFVFCNYTKVTPQDIDEFIHKMASTKEGNLDEVKGYGEFIKSNVNAFSEQELLAWTNRQTYLALGNLLNACAELKIDACPMEGFQAEAYNKVLGLDQLHLNAAVIAPIGYRTQDDRAQHRPKIRKSISDLFISL